MVHHPKIDELMIFLINVLMLLSATSQRKRKIAGTKTEREKEKKERRLPVHSDTVRVHPYRA